MANAVEKLYVSIGLDDSDLQVGLQKTDMTVNQAYAKLNHDAKKLRLETDIKINNLDGTGSELDKLKVKFEALGRQVDIAKQKQELASKVFAHNTASYGIDNAITKKSETSALNASKSLSYLQAQYRKTGEEIKKLDSTAGMSKLQQGMNKAKESASGLANGFGVVSAKWAAFLAVAGTGAGLISFSESAIQSGEAVYKLQNRLHTSTAEAVTLSRVFGITGTSVMSVTPYLARLDRTILRAGIHGNTTTQALSKFGITLTDSSGKLLPVSQQLAVLAQGYKRAQETGDEAAFSAEVLGNRGQELIPVLEDYAQKLRDAKSVQSSGMLNVEEAHQAYQDLMRLNMQISQLKSVFGAALIPIAKEMIPDIQSGLADMTKYIHDNKDDIKGAIEGWASAFGTVAKAAGGAAMAVSKAANVLSNTSDDTKLAEKYNEDLASQRKATNLAALLGGAGYGAVLGSSVFGVGAVPGAIVGGIASYYTANKAQDRAERNGVKYNPFLQDALNREKNPELYDGVLGKNKYGFGSQNLEKAKSDIFGLTEAQEKLAEAAGKSSDASDKAAQADKANGEAAKENASAQQEAAEAARYRATAMGKLQEELYKLTHNDLENSQRALALKEEEYRAQGIDDDTIAQFHTASMKKIAKDFNRNVTQPMASEFKNGLQKSLSDVDIQAQDWLDKGASDEDVAAWAQRKRDKIAQEFQRNVLAPMAKAFKTDLQNSLDDVDLQAQSYLEQGASKGDIEAWKNKRKSQITADWDNQVAEQIDSIWNSEYENQLRRIDREKKAWEKKGLDEVKATKWAEEQKKQLQQKNAVDMFTSQKKYLDIYRKAIASGMGQQGATQAIADQMRKDKGIPDNAFTSPSEIAGFEQAMHDAQSMLVPIISNGTYQGVKKAMVEVMRGTSVSNVIPDEDRARFGIGGSSMQDGGVDVMRGVQGFSSGVVSSGHSFKDIVVQAGNAFNGSVAQAAQDEKAKKEQEEEDVMSKASLRNAMEWNSDDSTLKQVNALKGNSEPFAWTGSNPHESYMNELNRLQEASARLAAQAEQSLQKQPRQVMQTQYDPQKRHITYDLNVKVSGLEDVENKVADTAAAKIIERMPSVGNSLSYASD